MHSEQPQSKWKIIKSFISGGIAGSVSKTIIAPIERVKYLFIVTHMLFSQTTSRKFTYELFIQDFVLIIKKHGVLNLWRGNLVGISRVFPHAAIDFAVFDFLRARFYSKDDSLKQKVNLFLCGAIAGLCALSVTTPLQFLRVRLAMERDNFSYKNISSALRIIYMKEGFLGFYRGYVASVLGIFIYHGCSFFIFTKLKELVKSISPKSYSKWYIDFALGGISSLGQLIAYPFDVIRKRMQGQMLLLAKNQIDKLHNYRELIANIYHHEGKLKGFYKGLSLNLIKAPTASATAWTVKNYLNRKMDETYDF